MRHLQLTEYKTESAFELSVEERDFLRDNKIDVAPTQGALGRYDLTPGSWIGALSAGSLAVEIRPKIPLDRVMFLISYALDPKKWRDTGFDFGVQDSLVEAVVPGFVRQVRRAFRRGVLQGYRVEEDALATVRGRIRFDDQIRHRFGIAPPIEVRFDEFTEDIDPNRLIKAAIRRLRRMRHRLQSTQSLLREFDGALASVSDVEYHRARLPAITWTPLNSHYRPAVELAKLILQSCSFELRHGRVRSTSFLVDMNRVFEDFVVTALREALGLTMHTLRQGATLHLDTANQIDVRPDLSWWEASRYRFVGDVKYKRLDAGEIKHADLYQLLSYTIAADLPQGLLIYAAGERDPGAHEIVHVGKRLSIETLELAGTPDEILGQIGRLAARIRRMKSRERDRAA
ncbi:MAG: hypothetical protein OXG46_00895 [Chloroflexi bacterium]|nr:hypothetical protein [Chloroflexota bacterium]MCY3937063.1 hypothetical protein [Chloroflexota bacterium]